MEVKGAQVYIDRILNDIEKRRYVDFTDRNSIRRYNAAMDRIIKNANYFCEHFPDQMDMYLKLVDHPDYQISATFTAILFGLRGSTKTHKLAALASARKLLLHPDADEIAKMYYWPYNIAKWEAELAQSKSDTL